MAFMSGVCVGEEPNDYIFEVQTGYVEKVESALEDWNKNAKDSPIWEIVYGDKLINGVNEHTGFKHLLNNTNLSL